MLWHDMMIRSHVVACLDMMKSHAKTYVRHLLLKLSGLSCRLTQRVIQRVVRLQSECVTQSFR